jgi:opacity protein-like surface antigen
MKRLIQFSMISSLLLSAQASALNPIGGFYGGIMAEVSHGPSNEEVYFLEDDLLFHGTVDYQPLSGGGGGFIGYKYNHFRLEGEILYNRISTGPLTVGSCTLESPNVQTPTGTCPTPEYDHFQAKALGYSGSSSAVYGLVNAYWDFFSYTGETFVVPYVGVGVGRAQIKNGNNFINTVNLYSHGHTVTTTSNAYQGILGLGYYMDDYTWASMDYRYLSTQNTSTLVDNSYALNTLNFTINFAFDKGAI